jgi:hypothetical protein
MGTFLTGKKRIRPQGAKLLLGVGFVGVEKLAGL